jgi:amidohydrolase
MSINDDQSLDKIKDLVAKKIDFLRPLVEDIAVSLYRHPELGLSEVYASSKLVDILDKHGFLVQKGLAGFDTAFKGVANVGDVREDSSERTTIAFMAEYDALPEIGHGCGHNLMAACALASAISCKELALPGKKLTWIVLGTPAEETVGSKVTMAEQGVFDHIDAAFIAHPGQRPSVGGGTHWASHPIEITFRGQPSHAGGNPEDGINALDACAMAYLGIRNLRNHLKDHVRLAGIITHGGDAPNIVPERAVMRFTVRSTDYRYLEDVVLPKVRQVAKSAADAVGAKVSFFHHEPLFRETLDYPVLQDIARANFARLGIEVPAPEGIGGGVTDVGSVTWKTPCIQIGFPITDARGHSRDMADATILPRGIEETLTAAKVMAFSALDLVFQPHLLEKAKDHLRSRNS